jgi:peroxiredoxin
VRKLANTSAPGRVLQLEGIPRVLRTLTIDRVAPNTGELKGRTMGRFHYPQFDSNMRISTLAFAAAVALGLLSALACAEDNYPTLAIGAAAPEFSLPGTDGTDHTLAQYSDAKVLLVLFTCNHCPTAQAYEERIKQIQADYSPKGVQLIAISPNDAEAVRLDELGYSDLGDSLEDMKLRAKEADFQFPYLFDGQTQKVSQQYGAKATPHAFVFDSERRLRYTGRIDDGEVGEIKTHDLRAALDAVLAGGDVKTPTTRVFGCSVKRASKRSAAAESRKQWEQEPVELEPIDSAQVKALVANETENYRLINLWATWCGPCIAELPTFVDINRMYRRRHFELITISMDEPGANEEALKILRQAHASMKNYHSAEPDTDKFAEAFDAEWAGPIPYTILVAPGGEIVYRKEGETDAQTLRREIVNRLGRTYASRKQKAE